jgi:serine/threonine-protein kinase
MLVCPLCRIALAQGEPTCPRDGTEGRDVDLEAFPAELTERFRVVEPFGKGDAGSLYIAEEVASGRRGLLKLVHHKASASVAERQRLKRELVKQATLQNPHLALPLVTGEAAGATWLFREWLDGVSLRVRLARDGRIAIPEALAITAQLATALDELHRAGLLHRDLEPGHILLQPQPNGPPRVVVIDAGVATPIETTAPFEVVGTPAYVSPEQANGKLVSFRSDLYALGCVLFEMVTGAPPFTGATDDVIRAHAEAQPPAAPADLPSGVRSLVEQLLAKEPRERPFSAQQARRAIEPFLPQNGAQRDPTMSYEPEQVAPPTNGGAPRKVERKATLMGIPMQAPSQSKPPAPPPDQGAPRAFSPSKPPPPPGGKAKAGADATQELDTLDIEEVNAPAVPQALGAPPAAKAPAADLDYDDLAETTLHVSMDMEVGDDMPKPVDDGRAIPPTSTMQSVDQGKLENAAESYLRQQPSPEASGGFPSQQQAQGYGQPAQPAGGGFGQPAQQQQQQSPGVWGEQPQQSQPTQQAYMPTPAAPIHEDSSEVAVPQKKKSKAGVFVLVGVLVFCLGSAGAAAGGWWWLTERAEGELAQLDRDLRQLETGAAPIGAEGTGAPVGDPFASTEAVAQPSEAAAQPTEGAGTEEAEVAAATETEQPEARSEREERPAAREERSERAERATRREERQARNEREERPAAREERAGGSGGASQFDQLREEARVHFQARRYAQAAQAYERAAAINPNHAPTFAGMGAARGAAGDSRGAVAAYQRAVELQPNHSGFNAALGRAYQMSGNRAAAGQAYQRALALDPNNRTARQGLDSLQ